MSRLLYLRDIGENPLLEYTFLDEKMYRDFVVLKSTKQFQEKRRKGKELVKINKNPVRLGKSGYHGKEAEWAKEDEAGVTIKGHHISSERIFARRKRDSSGALRLPPAIEPLTDEFIEKDIQASQGVLEIGHRSDLLIEVLGPEHSGRTRAVGHNIGPTKSGIYERRRKKYESRDTEANMSDNMYEKLKTRLMADMVDDIVPVVVAALKKDGTNVRSKTSTTVLDELHKMTKDKRPPSVPTQTACIHCDKAESEISLYSFEAADLLQAASLCSSFSHSLLNVERKPAKIKLRQSLSPASEVRP